jgi:hypothetical protein
MTDFGDRDDRLYTMVLPDRNESDGDGSDDERPRTVAEMEAMAVSTGHCTTATIYPVPLTPEEIINPDETFTDFTVFYMELETLDGTKHKLMLRGGGLMLVTQALKMHAQHVLEAQIRRDAPPEIVDVLDKIKGLIERLDREGDGG